MAHAEITDLRARRQAAQLSQERLARAADVSTRLIALAERGYQPTTPVATRIERALEEAEVACQRS